MTQRITLSPSPIRIRRCRAGRSQVSSRGTSLAQPDVGGRYSALSAFGLLPAALMGVDLESLERPALAMAEECRRADGGNPGVWLGSLMGQLASEGRNLVTLITSSGLERFGLWVEQLLAESTGKNGMGLVPIVSEPRLSLDYYGAGPPIRLRTPERRRKHGHRRIRLQTRIGRPTRGPDKRAWS